MQQRDLAYLLDMLDSAQLILTYVAGKSYEDFLGDVALQDAVVRRLTIIGEAARRVSGETRALLPDVPWHEVIGMRNVMVHRYEDVVEHRLWDTVRNDLPGLIEILGPLVPPENPPSAG